MSETPYVNDVDFKLHVGDVRDVLPRLEPDSIDCALTSPPFYALRDYGVEGQIGLEATPDEWAAELVAVFRDVRRLLKPTGTLWVECGDSYASAGLTAKAVDDRPAAVIAAERGYDVGSNFSNPPGTKAKDLIGAPWLLAFALRADGWYLRQCIVWQKPNAMPESAKDRCTTAHSYVFLLSKQPRYWFDAEAIAEPAEWARWGDQTTAKYEGTQTATGWMQSKTKRELVKHRTSRPGIDVNGGGQGSGTIVCEDTKNARSVWSIPTAGFAEAHFATWPEALVERIVKAGCPEAVCRACGKPRERLTEQGELQAAPNARFTAEEWDGKQRKGQDGWSNSRGIGSLPPNHSRPRETVGWSDCGCGAGFTPGTVLDPFMGSGTTALVARRLGRRSVGCELNAEYAEMAARRLGQQSLFAEGVA